MPATGGGAAVAVGRAHSLGAPSFRPFFAVKSGDAGECRQIVMPAVGRRREGPVRCRRGQHLQGLGSGGRQSGMADQQVYPSLEALRKLEESLAGHFCEQEPPAADEVRRQRASPISWWRRLWVSRLHRVDPPMSLLLWWPRLRKLALVGGGLGGLAALAVGALWWRLSSGPIELDMATPWLTVAIKQNLGGGHDVEIGGTQLERDANGHTSLRIRDIVVRDADGSIVASAPKAEVGISGIGLFTGRIR